MIQNMRGRGKVRGKVSGKSGGGGTRSGSGWYRFWFLNLFDEGRRIFEFEEDEKEECKGGNS